MSQGLAWKLGRVYMGLPARALSRLRAYGVDRIPRTGGLVLAINHLHWIDVPIVGTTPEAIHLAEERGAFGRVLAEAGLPAPKHGMATSFEEAQAIAARLSAAPEVVAD